MRAYHLDRNWATNCFHSKGFTLGWKKPNDYHRIVRVDGDLLAIDNEFTTPQSIKVYDIRRRTLQCVIAPVESTIAPVAGGIKFTDGVIVVPCLGGVACAFDARTGKLLQKIDLHLGSRYMLLFFDGELVITYECAANKRENNEKFCDIYVSCVKDGQLQRTLTVDLTDGVKVCYYNVDYRDKMVAAVYNDDYIRVWDARSGECLHQLKCPGEESKVKLGDNVIVGFSKAFDMEVCDIIIWSQDTGECQKVIREVPSHRYVRPYAYVLNNLIIYYDQISGPGDHFYFMYVYNLRKESGMEKVHHCGDPRRNETKSVYIVLEEPEYRCEKAWPSAVCNATPNGLVRLFDAGTNHIIWIDDIRMILIDNKKHKLRVHHYW
ncbi:uncharacterized protein LOC119735146 [Patiria miniata]|uniref:Uncharacterized protein n=1 Tax=Patiria miniata TaxID=46514 RepID=A0A914AMN4_PATMI|nr:uncharacterized protein LOC119735146 [Patiria miniata]